MSILKLIAKEIIFRRDVRMKVREEHQLPPNLDCDLCSDSGIMIVRSRVGTDSVLACSCYLGLYEPFTPFEPCFFADGYRVIDAEEFLRAAA